ncbi:hypothetical protein C6500_21325 [Candidatus Poribacteria bacterium]|nr:MAG: hypothetical protein C6500_21325 [Candidatus Poribacteria bacterium]
MKLTGIGMAILLFTLPAWAGTFLEDFDTGNLEDWEEFLMNDAPPGSWKIVNDELHAVSPDGWTRLLTIGDKTWRDYTIEFDVKPLKKPGRGNIAIAARISGDWAVWCMIGDHPLPGNISMAVCAAGNFRDPSPLFFFGFKPHESLGLKIWSRLKLVVEENTLNFWINEDHALGPIQLPDRETFIGRDAVRKKHIEEHHPDENLRFRPMQLDGFRDFLSGAVGLGLSNQTARFDNVVITGDSIPDSRGLSVTPKAKLATVWGSLKRF